MLGARQVEPTDHDSRNPPEIPIPVCDNHPPGTVLPPEPPPEVSKPPVPAEPEVKAVKLPVSASPCGSPKNPMKLPLRAASLLSGLSFHEASPAEMASAMKIQSMRKMKKAREQFKSMAKTGKPIFSRTLGQVRDLRRSEFAFEEANALESSESYSDIVDVVPQASHSNIDEVSVLAGNKLKPGKAEKLLQHLKWCTDSERLREFAEHNLGPLCLQLPSVPSRQPICAAVSESFQLAGFANGSTSLWFWRNHHQEVFSDHEALVRAVAFDTDELGKEQAFASASDNGQIVMRRIPSNCSGEGSRKGILWNRKLPSFKGSCILDEAAGRVGRVLSEGPPLELIWDGSEESSSYSNAKHFKHFVAFSALTFCSQGLGVGTNHGVVLVISRADGSILTRCTLEPKSMACTPNIATSALSASLPQAETGQVEDEDVLKCFVESRSASKMEIEEIAVLRNHEVVTCMASLSERDELLVGTLAKCVWVIDADGKQVCCQIPEAVESFASGADCGIRGRGLNAIAANKYDIFAAVDCSVWMWESEEKQGVDSWSLVAQSVGEFDHPVQCLAVQGDAFVSASIAGEVALWRQKKVFSVIRWHKVWQDNFKNARILDVWVCGAVSATSSTSGSSNNVTSGSNGHHFWLHSLAVCDGYLQIHSSQLPIVNDGNRRSIVKDRADASRKTLSSDGTSDGPAWVSQNQQFLVAIGKKYQIVVYDFQQAKNECWRPLVRLSGHLETISCVCMTSRDWDEGGGWLFSGSLDDSVRCWNLALHLDRSGKLVDDSNDEPKSAQIVLQHKSSVLCVCVGRKPTKDEGHLLFCGLETGIVAIWLWEAKRCLQELQVGGEIRSLSTNQSHRLIVGSTNNKVFVWDDGLIDSAGRIKPDTHAKGVKVRFELKHKLCEHRGNVNAVFLGFFGKRMFSASSDCKIFKWDVQGMSSHPYPERILTGHSNAVTSITMAADMQVLVSGDAMGKIFVWDLRSGSIKEEVEVHQSSIVSLQLVESTCPETLTTVHHLVSVSKPCSLVISMLQAAQHKTRLGHHLSISEVKMSSNSRLALSAGWDSVICLWDLRNRTLRNAFFGHTGVIFSIDMTEDGTSFVSGSADNTVRVWDSLEGEKVCIKKGQSVGEIGSDGHEDYVTSVRMVQKDDKSLVVLSGGLDHRVLYWELPSNWRKASKSNSSVLHQLIPVGYEHDTAISSVALRQDLAWAAYGGNDGSMGLWALNDPSREKGCVEAHAALKLHTKRVNSLCFSRLGYLMAGANDGIVSVWNLGGTLEVCRLVKVLTHDVEVRSIDVSCDGRCIYVGCERELVVWDAVCASIEKRCSSDALSSVSTADCGRYVLSGSSSGNLILWDIWHGTSDKVLVGHDDGVLVCAFSEDGRRLVSGGMDNVIIVWNLIHGGVDMKLFGHTGNVCTVSLSDDGFTLLSGSWDGRVILWDLKAGRVQLRLHAEGAVLAVKLVKDQSMAISTDRRCKVMVWDLPHGSIRCTLSVDTAATCFCYTQQQLLVGCSDSCLQWFNISQSKLASDDASQSAPLVTEHSGPICALALCREATMIISACTEGVVLQWRCTISENAVQYELVRSFAKTDDFASGVQDGLEHVSVSDDGHFMLVAHKRSHMSMWQIGPDGKQWFLRPLAHWIEHTKSISTVCLSSDARHAASCSYDGRVVVHPLTEFGRPLNSSIWYNWPSLAAAGRQDDTGMVLRDLLSGLRNCVFEKLHPLGWTLLQWFIQQDTESIGTIDAILDLSGTDSIGLAPDVFGLTPLDYSRNLTRPDIADAILADAARGPVHTTEFLGKAVASLLPMDLASMPSFLDSRLQAPLQHFLQPIPDRAAISAYLNDNDDDLPLIAIRHSSFSGLSEKDYRIYLAPRAKKRESGAALLPTTINCIFFHDFLGARCNFLNNLCDCPSKNIFTSKAVRIILLQKWHAFGLRAHLKYLAIFLTQLACFQVYLKTIEPRYCQDILQLRMLAPRGGPGTSDDSSSVQDYDDVRCEGPLQDILGIVDVVIALYMLWIEYQQLTKCSFYAYITDIPWNHLNLLANFGVIITVITTFAKLEDDSSRSIASLTVFFVWMQLFYFMRGFRHTGALVRMVLEIIHDMRPFMLLMIVMTMAFSTSALAMHPEKYDSQKLIIDGVSTDGYFIWQLYHGAWFGSYSTSDYEKSGLDMVMFLVQSLLMLVVMLNLLIAIMGDTYSRVKEEETVTYFRELADLIDEIEDRMSAKQLSNREWFPEYLLFSTRRMVSSETS